MKAHKLAVAVSFLLGAILMVGQQVESASVQGKVVDAQGQPVPQATVEFAGANTGARFATRTDKNGGFVKIGVKEDNYAVTVTKDGQVIGRVKSYSVTYAEAPPPLTITTGKAEEPAAPAPSPVPLTPAEQQALQDLQKQAAAVPKKDDQAILGKLQAAQASFSAGDWERVIALATEITGMDPMNHEAWARIGFADIRTGKYDLAVAAFTRAVALRPGFAGYHQNLAVALAKTGKVDEGVAEFAAAALAEPASAAREYFLAGVLLSDHNRPSAAVDAFDKAIAADPIMADAYYFKGINLIVQGKEVEGKLSAPPGTADAFKKYLELSPSGSHAASARAQLARLPG